MSEDNDKDLEEEPEEADDTVDDETEDDDLLPDSSPPASGGGSGGIVAVIVLFIVIVLVAAAWWQRETRREEAEKALDQHRQFVGTQLGNIHDNLAAAREEIESNDPDMDRVIESLNSAAEQMGYVAKESAARDSDMANRFLDLQSKIRSTAQAVDDHHTQYLDTIKAARKELKKASLDEIKPLADNIQLLATEAVGDVDTPLRLPGSSSAGEDVEEADDEDVSAGEETEEDESESEAPEE